MSIFILKKKKQKKFHWNYKSNPKKIDTKKYRWENK